MNYPETIGTAAAAAAIVLFGTPAVAETLTFSFSLDDFTDPTTIDNDFWPATVLGTAVYRSEADDGCEVSQMVIDGTTTDFSGAYAGIEAVVVTDREWIDEDCSGDYVLAESTSDWYAQDDSNNVWYLGEDTTAWDDEADCLTGSGSWRAGDDDAEAGVVMPGAVFPGASYRQELFEGEAEDEAKVLRLNASVEIGLGTFEHCLVTKEYTGLSPGEIEHKSYCRLSQGGFGLTKIDELKGKTRRVEYIGDALPAGDFPVDFPTSDVCTE